jgi:hypothetical protein
LHGEGMTTPDTEDNFTNSYQANIRFHPLIKRS